MNAANFAEAVATYAETPPDGASDRYQIHPGLRRLAKALRDGAGFATVSNYAWAFSNTADANEMDRARMRCVAKRLDRRMRADATA